MGFTGYYFEDGYIAYYAGKAPSFELTADKRKHGKIVKIVKK